MKQWTWIKIFLNISEVVLVRVIGETGFYFVLDKDGTYIIHPNKSVLEQNWLGKEDFTDYIIQCEAIYIKLL